MRQNEKEEGKIRDKFSGTKKGRERIYCRQTRKKRARCQRDRDAANGMKISREQ